MAWANLVKSSQDLNALAVILSRIATRAGRESSAANCSVELDLRASLKWVSTLVSPNAPSDSKHGALHGYDGGQRKMLSRTFVISSESIEVFQNGVVDA